jgi:FkbM family methyltransferase
MQALKRNVQTLLKRAYLYERIKESWFYDFFWRICDRKIVEERAQELAFYRHALPGFRKGDLVFDIGANQGAKAAIFLRLGARVLAVDPDQVNQRILTEKFKTYRFFKKPIAIVGNAVSDKVGVGKFWIDQAGSGKNTLSVKWVETLRQDSERFGQRLRFAEKMEVNTVTLDQLIETFGTPVFIKIDVEGHELNVLKGLSHPIPLISFEVNLPEFESEGLECMCYLEKLSPGGVFNYTVESRSELASTRWMPHDELAMILRGSPHRSVEVYWKANLSDRLETTPLHL